MRRLTPVVLAWLACSTHVQADRSIRRFETGNDVYHVILNYSNDGINDWADGLFGAVTEPEHPLTSAFNRLAVRIGTLNVDCTNCESGSGSGPWSRSSSRAINRSTNRAWSSEERGGSERRDPPA